MFIGGIVGGLGPRLSAESAAGALASPLKRGGLRSCSLRVPVPKHKMSTQNKYNDAEDRNPTYPIVGYFGAFGIVLVGGHG